MRLLSCNPIENYVLKRGYADNIYRDISSPNPKVIEDVHDLRTMQYIICVNSFV